MELLVPLHVLRDGISSGDGYLRVHLHVYTHLVVGRGATNVLPSDRLSF